MNASEIFNKVPSIIEKIDIEDEKRMSESNRIYQENVQLMINKTLADLPLQIAQSRKKHPYMRWISIDCHAPKECDGDEYISKGTMKIIKKELKEKGFKTMICWFDYGDYGIGGIGYHIKIYDKR